MKKLLLLLLLLASFCVAQKPTENQRFQIVDLGTDGNEKLNVLLDTETGKCWELMKDTVYYFKPGIASIFWDGRHSWVQIYFINDIPGSTFHTTTPMSKPLEKYSKSDSFVPDEPKKTKN